MGLIKPVAHAVFSLLVLLWMAGSPAVLARTPDGDCLTSDTARIWVSPGTANAQRTIRVLGVSTEEPADTLSVIDDQGREAPVRTTSGGGPPWSLRGTLSLEPHETIRLELRRGERMLACRRLDADDPASWEQRADDGWTLPVEAFYAAWIEILFDAPAADTLSFKSLEPVIRDPQRNILFNHLGQNEDARLPATPDCADLPYFLRAYFAWKIGLPVSWRACDRGTGNRPPRCGPPTIDTRFTRGSASAASFSGLMRQVADTVHSGSARTGLADESTDFYPVALERAVLWPGTVYADPYGHTLIIAKWLPPAAGHSGLLLAADAQPDNSVARKRFWEGNFLFATTAAAGPGFKAFRPLLRDGGQWRLPGNAWLSVHAPAGGFSDEQAGMAPDDFYATVGKQINPQGLAPEQAYDAMLDALVEQLETRVEAVENGEHYVRQHRGAVIPMPAAAAIFQTTGAWEDYATPSRDLRLLIALKVLNRLPQQMTAYPSLFTFGGRSPEEARHALEARHEQRIHDRHFTYTRSDGSPWQLSVAEVFERREALEMGYNPNTCVEYRWGAVPGSPEAETCTRQAPADQLARMAQYRSWFRNTQRPIQ